MRNVIVLGFALLAAGITAIAFRGGEAGAVPAPAPVNFKWEYRALPEAELIALTEGKTTEAGLNKLGEEGWELAAIRGSEGGKGGGGGGGQNPRALFCLKRLKPAR
jgi:hypothetical protein